MNEWRKERSKLLKPGPKTEPNTQEGTTIEMNKSSQDDGENWQLCTTNSVRKKKKLTMLVLN